MKVAKNMDSVFASCTSDEITFDLFFDDDDTIIDIVNGIDEAGVPLTGEDPEVEYQLDGDASGDESDAEGTKETDLEIGGEVGDGKEVTGKENSAESKADEVTKDIEDAIGNEPQQRKLGEGVDGEVDPLTDCDDCERAGAVPAGTVNTQSDVEEAPENPPVSPETDVDIEIEPEIKEAAEGEEDNNDFGEEKDTVEDECTTTPKKESAMDKLCDMILAKISEAPEVSGTDDIDKALSEAEDPIEDACDNAEREGEVKHDTKDVEGVSVDIIGAVNKGTSNEDPIEDTCDNAEREGEVKHDTKDVEGVAVRTVAAADESVDIELEEDGDIDSDMDDMLDNPEEEKDDDEVVPDSIQVASVANDIPSDIVNNNEAADQEVDIDLDDDDDDIELIKSEKLPEGKNDLKYDYDDDELIDMIINGEE